MKLFELFEKLCNLSKQKKLIFLVGLDFLITCVTYFVSFQVRFEQFFLDDSLLHSYTVSVLPYGVLTVVSLFFFNVYAGIIRFASIYESFVLVKGISIASFAGFVFFSVSQDFFGVPRSIFIINWAFQLLFIPGIRVIYRYLRSIALERKKGKISSKKTLIIGAGEAARLLIREIHNDFDSDIEIVGLLDDDLTKKNKLLNGYKVFGKIADLAEISKEKKADSVIIAIPSLSTKKTKEILAVCNRAGLKTQQVPKLSDIISGKVNISRIQTVSPVDLLGRDEVKLDETSILNMIGGQVVLISGAGGSIGSELCRQVLRFKPKELVCLDVSEFNLYQLKNEFDAKSLRTNIEYCIGDVRDKARLEEVFSKNMPKIVFHAAAYKHVPMMERNPLESVKVNVLGTKNMVDLSSDYQVENFVLISTDKAVNPTNVMGATKRVAEMVCQEKQKESKTIFSMVRFGNVLGSSGSVIPRFKEQIRNGGPVTVTHPEIIRYFMSIPEAAQLVIQAGTLGTGADVFVLDMGEPVKIVDLAKDLIKRSGLTLGEDIDIEFTGLRPGEKLYEELLHDKEKTIETYCEKIKRAKVSKAEGNFNIKLFNLFEVKEENLKDNLARIVLDYNFQSNYRSSVESRLTQ